VVIYLGIDIKFSIGENYFCQILQVRVVGFVRGIEMHIYDRYLCQRLAPLRLRLLLGD
jgi:hypothetical protein